MAKLNPADTLPQSSQDALQIFDERYIAALQVVQPQTWVNELGDTIEMPALETRYPMSLLSLKFEETIAGEGRFKAIGEKDVPLTVAEYDEGIEIELMKLLTNAFSARKWAEGPALLVQAEEAFKLRMIASMLEANTETCGWDGLALFHDAHKANPVGGGVSATFDNLQGSAKNVVDLGNIEAELTAGLEVLDMNGDPLGVDYDTIVVPRQKYNGLKNLLKQDFVPNTAGTATMRNPYNAGELKVQRIDQFTDSNDWYLVDSKLVARGVSPWICAKLNLPNPGFDALSLRRWDESSDLFKKHGKIAVSKHVYYGAKPLFPHAIRKVVGA